MAEAFGSNQSVTPAQGVSAGSSFIAPVRQSNMGNILKPIADFAEDFYDKSQKREVGSFIADSRKRLSGITNPVERNVLQEQLFQKGLKAFGSDHARLIQGSLETGDIKRSLGADGRSIISTDELTGKSAAEPLRGPSSFKSDLHETFAETETSYSNLSAATEKLVVGRLTQEDGSIRADANGFHTFTISSAQRLNKMEQSMASANADLQFLNTDPQLAAEYKKKTADTIKNDIISMAMQFNHPVFLGLLADKTTKVTPNDVMMMYNGYVADVMENIMEYDLGASIGLDVSDIRTELNAIQSRLGGEGGVLQTAFRDGVQFAKREVDHLNLANESKKLAAELKLSDDARMWIASKPAIEAISSFALVNDKLAGMLSSENPINRAAYNKAGVVMGSLLGLEQVGIHLSSLKARPILDSSSSTEVQFAWNVTRDIFKAGGAGAGVDGQVFDYWAKQKGNMGKLVEQGVIPQQLMDNIYGELEQVGKRINKVRKEVSDETGKPVPENQSDLLNQWQKIWGHTKRILTPSPPNPMPRPKPKSETAE